MQKPLVYKMHLFYPSDIKYRKKIQFAVWLFYRPAVTSNYQDLQKHCFSEATLSRTCHCAIVTSNRICIAVNLLCCICLISFFAHWFSLFYVSIRFIIYRCGFVFGFTVINAVQLQMGLCFVTRVAIPFIFPSYAASCICSVSFHVLDCIFFLQMLSYDQ